MGRRANAVFAVLALLIALSAVPAGASGSTPIVRKLNVARHKHGLPSLRFSPSLSRSSSRYARYLIRVDRFGHASRIRAASRFHLVGEALAWHPGWRAARSYTLRSWLHSPPHRALMLSRQFRYVGAGKARGRLGSVKATVWVMQFGRR
jgi:uncharacterized protein YkwD